MDVYLKTRLHSVSDNIEYTEIVYNSTMNEMREIINNNRCFILNNNSATLSDDTAIDYIIIKLKKLYGTICPHSDDSILRFIIYPNDISNHSIIRLYNNNTMLIHNYIDDDDKKEYCNIVIVFNACL